MVRTFTEVGKVEYLPEEIEQSIKGIKWEPFRTTDLPFCQGECLKVVIKECKIPVSKIRRMSLHGVIKETYGFYALDVTYKNGRALIYLADNGCSAVVVASDFYEKRYGGDLMEVLEDEIFIDSDLIEEEN